MLPFEIHRVTQYLVNFTGLVGIVSIVFARTRQFLQVSGMANWPNFWHCDINKHDSQEKPI